MKKFILWPLMVVFFGLGVLIVFGYFRFYQPLSQFKSLSLKSQTDIQELAIAVKTADLGLTKAKINILKSDLSQAKQIINGLSWLNFLPFARHYYSDMVSVVSAADSLLQAGSISVDAVSPYADLLGLKGVDSGSLAGKTAQDRINFLVKTIELIKPQMDQISAAVNQAKAELDQIDPNRYPTHFQGQPVREKLVQAIVMVDQAAALLSDAQPFLQSAPYILGLDKPRKYLLIFQNDAEIRPTGGFMTAYAIIQVDKSKISILAHDDIYGLDAKFDSNLKAPDIILKYLPKVYNWHLRDMNLSPDLRVSMETFYPNYLKTGSPPIDGIFTIDTKVLVEILKVIGPVGVSGFGTYSADLDKRCNCPQVFYELELFADVEGPVIFDNGEVVAAPKNYGQRKSFIGPMMNSVLLNVMAQPKSKMGQLFTAGIRLIKEKHLQAYFLKPEIQQGIESFNLAGRVRTNSGDYLLVVDTNFGGAKTNAWVTYTAEQDIHITKDGKVTKTLTLKYNNPQAYFEDPKTKLKLNGMFRNYLRVYVPKGSRLIEAKGFEIGQSVSQDLNKTVFEGFFTLAPLNVRTITFKYELPGQFNSPYKLLIQKQAGSGNFLYKIKINGQDLPETVLSGDTDIVYPF